MVPCIVQLGSNKCILHISDFTSSAIWFGLGARYNRQRVRNEPRGGSATEEMGDNVTDFALMEFYHCRDIVVSSSVRFL